MIKDKVKVCVGGLFKWPLYFIIRSGSGLSVAGLLCREALFDILPGQN